MKIGAIYVYYDPVNLHCVYTGSIQNFQTLINRHKDHLHERKSIGPWLRQFKGVMPVVIEKFLYEKIPELHARENYWMKELKTLALEGGFNKVSAGGQDHAAMGRIGGRIGGLKGGKRVHELYPELMKEAGRKGIQRACELNPGLRKRMGIAGGKITGSKNLKHAWKYSRDKLLANQKKVASLGGKIGGPKMQVLYPGLTSLHMLHSRWHIRRHLQNPNCSLCCQAWVKRRQDLLRLFEIASSG